MLTINADGNVFACFMLMYGPNLCLGNVNERNHEFGLSDSLGALLADADEQLNPACKTVGGNRSVLGA